MKQIKLTLGKFCGINELSMDIDPDYYWNDYRYRDEDIICNTCKDSIITGELIQSLEELRSSLVTCLAMADEARFYNSAYKANMDSIEKTFDNVIDFLNGMGAKVKGNIDLVNETITLEFEDAKLVANVLIEIINGEGYFRYETVEELAEAMPSSIEKAIEDHLHYLLNAKLISSIFGDRLVAEVKDNGIVCDVDYKLLEKELELTAIEFIRSSCEDSLKEIERLEG